MQKKYLEAGEIVSTHGVQGEVKILPWADGPEFLLQFDTFYLDGRPYAVRSARVHKTCVLASLEGIDTPEPTDFAVSSCSTSVSLWPCSPISIAIVIILQMDQRQHRIGLRRIFFAECSCGIVRRQPDFSHSIVPNLQGQVNAKQK